MINKNSKERMAKQKSGIYNGLSDDFQLPVFEDEITEREKKQIETENKDSYFLIVYGDFNSTNSVGNLIQEIYVVYVSENNPDVEEKTIDIISTISNVGGVEFSRTVKERYQKGDTQNYLDQVTLIFQRKVKYEYQL